MRLQVTLAGRAGPHRPAVDGAQRHAPGRRRCSARWRRTEPAPAGDRRAASSARRSRWWRIEGGVAANVVPDRVELADSTTASPPTAPPAEAEAHVRAGDRPLAGAGRPVRGGRRGRRGRARHRPSADRPRWSSATSWPSKPSWAGPTWPASPSSASPRPTSGPGDATLAHTAGEFVTGAELDAGLRGARRSGATGRRWARRLRRLAAVSHRRSRRGSRTTSEEQRWPSRSGSPPRSSR